MVGSGRLRLKLLAIAAVSALAAGCHSCPGYPRIDKSGEHCFTAAPPHTVKFEQEPGKVSCSNECQVKLMPARIIAPVGSEVVLMASVCGQDGFLTANEEVEWLLAPGGVGQFMALNERGNFDFLLGAPSPKKLTPTYAIGATSSRYVHINRGTPTPTDDIEVLRGQAWITVTSPVEGSSHVTAFAPKVYAWDKRQQNSTIHWVDAEWSFPPPGINPAGSTHVFTTSVMRHSTHAPVAGWIVRYEIKGGPPAAFNAEAQTIEVVTNSLGQASAEIHQTDNTPGVNTIGVEIIRPGDSSSDNTRLTVGTGATSQTWGSSQQLSIDKSGPAQANIGANATYRIEVRNNSSAPVQGVVVSDTLTQGMTFVASDPVIVARGPQLDWSLGEIPPGAGRVINLTLRLDAPGTLNNCATVRDASGATAQDCVATTVTSASLEVSLAGPSTVVVGDLVPFVATVTNRSSTTATNLIVVDRFDPGLKHEQIAGSKVESTLPDLAPGQSYPVEIKLRALTPGQQCNRIEVMSEGTVRAQSQACVQVAAASSAPPVVAPPIGTSPPPASGEKPVLTVRKLGPAKKQVGELAEFTIDVTNTGTVAATNVKITDNYDAELLPDQASAGNRPVGNGLSWLYDTLPAGQTIKLGVKCKCIAKASKTCNQLTVSCQEGVRADGQACLEVTAGASALSLSIGDLRDPVVPLGTQTTYAITVTNEGTEIDRQVRLVVTLPEELTPLIIGTSGDSPSTITGQTVTFGPVAQLEPGGKLNYRVEARGIKPVTGAITRAEVTSAASDLPKTATTTTDVKTQ